MNTISTARNGLRYNTIACGWKRHPRSILAAVGSGRIWLLLSVFLCLPTAPVRAQTTQPDRNQFYSLVELTELIQKTKEAGFSDEQIKNMQIKDGDKVINVMDYIRKIENKRIFEQKQLEDFRNRKFLTVQDIYGELIKLEPDALTRLREELTSGQ